MTPPLPQTRRCSHAGFWISISLLALFLVISLLVNMGLFVGLAAKSTTSIGGQAEDQFPSFTEKWSYGSGDVKAVRIAVEGAIFRESEESIFGIRYDRIEAILRQIRAAACDDSVQAIILEVDSPGGDLTASDEIYKALEDFKWSADDRKVVVFVRSMAASGGYYISAPGDWIIAEPTSIIGSIGVIMQTLNWKGLSDRIGLTDVTIKSGANKDMLNPFRDVSTQQVAQLQVLIDSMYQQFLSIVQTNRGIDAKILKPIADGRIFSADVALQYGLIDQIGYWDDAVAKTAELLGEKSIRVVRYERRPEFFELLSEIKSPISLTHSSLSEAATPRLMYLWRP